mmetsp:Transcript_35963/g.80052  ORF Transcript_35963/g.80052 Transcript_35963/m.80052 type:complete len:320 (-) Transcript_35963:349-1308(-)
MDSDLLESKGSFPCKRGGYDIHFITIAPQKSSSPRAALVFHHGFLGYSEYHKDALRQYASAGYLVYALDAHGHGHSGSRLPAPKGRALVENFQHLVDDLLTLMDQVVLPGIAPHGGLPVFAMGHSMGGMTVMLAASQRRGLFSGLILLAPLTQLAPNPLVGGMMSCVAGCVSGLCGGTFGLLPQMGPEEGCIRDPAACAAWYKDEIWCHGKIKVASVRSMMQACDMLDEAVHAGHLTGVPILAQHGTDDKATSCAASKQLLSQLEQLNAASAGGKDLVRFVEIPGAYHDLDHDPETKAVIRRNLEWLEARLGAGVAANK